jgi:imidazolonepropionase-like amidohydrolase
MKRIIISIIVCCALFAQAQSDKVNAIALSGGTAHLGNGEKIENAVVVIQNGHILFVGEKSEFDVERENKLNDSFYAEIINTYGMHIYPGLIALNTIAGLNEIDALRQTRDYDEVGALNPHVRSCIAYNTDSEILPTLAANGILTVEATPRGGRISGKSSLMRSKAWNWEDALVKEDIGVHMNWPAQFRQTGWWANPGTIKENEDYKTQVDEIYNYFDEALAYSKVENNDPENLRFEAMRDVFNRNIKLFIHVDESRSILEILELKKKYEIDIVLVGAKEAWRIADIIAKSETPVVLKNIHDLPSNRADDIDQVFRLPAILDKAGVKFALSIGGSWEVRNLPFVAGSAVAYGLDYEKAVASITGNAAEICGAENIGTIEQDKAATLIVSQGDLLEMQESIIEYAFIDGKMIDLSNRHLELYEKFQGKYKSEQ